MSSDYVSSRAIGANVTITLLRDGTTSVDPAFQRDLDGNTPLAAFRNAISLRSFRCGGVTASHWFGDPSPRSTE